MKTYNVAILGAGTIAQKMAVTLRGMENVVCYAIGSRSIDKAQHFANEWGFTKAYGSYEELVADSNVDLIYVATPHSEHYEITRLCIAHGKPALVEKSFTVNEKQAAELFDFAMQKNVFVTEAMWIRYMPFADTIRAVLASGVIGKPQMLTANLGYPIAHVPRLTRPELAGGALLDVGVYPINFASMIFGDDIARISSTCTYTQTGVDEQDSITLVYSDGRMAVLNSSMVSASDRKGIIHGSSGYMIIENINNFEHLSVFNSNNTLLADYLPPPQITGYEYEVMASLAAIESGKLECAEMSHSETLRMMRIMDNLRKDWNITYPCE